jgi:hypothetical protein
MTQNNVTRLVQKSLMRHLYNWIDGELLASREALNVAVHQVKSDTLNV